MPENEPLDLDAYEPESSPGPTFRFDKREWHCRPADEVGQWVWDELAAAAAQQTTTLVRLGDFFRQALVPAESDDFMAMLNRPDSPMTRAHANKLIEYVLTEMADRPTQPPSSSGDGRQRTRVTSPGAASSRATRRASAG
jgi:hypothetical protein